VLAAGRRLAWRYARRLAAKSLNIGIWRGGIMRRRGEAARQSAGASICVSDIMVICG